MRSDDLVANGESQPGSFPGSFRCDKQFEYLWQYRRIDTWAAIRYL